MRQVLGAGALGRPRGMGWGGRWEGGLGWGIYVNPWLIHVNVWQKPQQYCKVISLQPIKINGKKIKIKTKKKKQTNKKKLFKTIPAKVNRFSGRLEVRKLTSFIEVYHNKAANFLGLVMEVSFVVNRMYTSDASFLHLIE